MHTAAEATRAWIDPLHPDREQGNFAHPSGSAQLTELTELEMGDVSGAATGLVGTLGCCWCVPWYSGWTVCGLLCSHPGCR